MSNHIYFCKKCNQYTMKRECPECKEEALSTKPAKYSPDDKWGKYRRMAKAES